MKTIFTIDFKISIKSESFIRLCATKMAQEYLNKMKNNSLEKRNLNKRTLPFHPSIFLFNNFK
jgi:FMN-dependent NADH-azoreductase